MYKLLLGLTLAMLLLACEKKRLPAPKPVEQTLNFSGFTRIHAGETFNLTVKQGANFAIVASGRSEDLEDLVGSIEHGNILSLRYSRFKPGRNKVDIDITLPLLTKLHLIDAATASITGFSQQSNSLQVLLAGVAKCTVSQLPLLVNAYLSANSELTLNGTAGDLVASVLANAKLHAYGATFDDADVYTQANATARVKVQNSLAAFATDNSRIYYKGSPTSVNKEESGLAKVIHE